MRGKVREIDGRDRIRKHGLIRRGKEERRSRRWGKRKDRKTRREGRKKERKEKSKEKENRQLGRDSGKVRLEFKTRT